MISSWTITITLGAAVGLLISIVKPVERSVYSGYKITGPARGPTVWRHGPLNQRLMTIYYTVSAGYNHKNFGGKSTWPSSPWTRPYAQLSSVLTGGLVLRSRHNALTFLCATNNDKRMNKRMDGRMNGWIHGWMIDGFLELHVTENYGRQRITNVRKHVN